MGLWFEIAATSKFQSVAMLIRRLHLPRIQGCNLPNTFGEWNKWDDIRKKGTGNREEPSESMEGA
ncbi:hypothetical protein GCM10011585_01660 [Edaphobacter dinghuensis]|uniref:Uncharacterized protein n=1 Tax=Edaphobacter dinghuensis TaxID=1560005 RepID=A0A917LXI8_9BACT|nr:hypothetical protein GCM10011585_01660 [Edaphobacter dinghuensis]